MAHDVSARPAGRWGNGSTGRRSRPPTAIPEVRRAVARAAAGALVVAWLVPGPVSAAEGLDISTPYPAVAVAPGSRISFAITVATATPGRVDLAVQNVPAGWIATLRGGGFVVNGVQTTPDVPAEVTLDVDIPADASGSQDLTVRATSGGLTSDLTLSLRIEAEAEGDVTLSTDFPALRGPADVTFPFNLDLSNDTPQELTFTVEVAQVPPGWQATATITGQEQAASAPVDAGGSVGIQVEVTPPQTVAAGTYPIVVTATSGARQVSTELQVEITGSYSMRLSTPDERLNTSGAAGSEIRQTIQIENTGTSPLEGLTLSAANPAGWSVRFEPPEVPAVPPGSGGGNPAQVTAIITPSGDAIAGDYQVSITASNEAAASQTIDLRVTVETSLLWGLIGLAIIIAVFAGLWWVFQRYGRR
ncbi:MAG TPA: NEW3 domain-containing protein [Vitreimonas sp.]|nr:NEW3 domain-containing protein [Vitreimonas sp.]